MLVHQDDLEDLDLTLDDPETDTERDHMMRHEDDQTTPLSKGEHNPSCCSPYGTCNPKRRRFALVTSIIAIILIIVIAVLVKKKKDDDGPMGVWNNIRLNRVVVPNHYHLTYNINLTRFDFDGLESIELDITSITDTIVLHSRGLNVSDVKIGGPSSIYTPSNTFFYPENEFFVIQFSSSLSIGTYALNLTFHGKLRDELAGLYRSSYVTSKGVQHWMATTQFESTDARAAFPCFDEPSFKANFTITITCESQYHALSNMPVKKEITNIDSRTFEFDTSVKMSTYLVAMVVSDFVSVSANTTSTRYPNSKKVSIWTQAEKINQTIVALNASTKILSYYEDLYQAEFPLPKQDLIAIPDFAAGAMENWGLITFRENSLLFDPEESSQVNEQRVVVVVAHELAHQWFGDLVTMDWWSELWLNEGFASYVEYIGTNFVAPEWDMNDQFIYDTTHSALTLDSTQNTHPVLQQVMKPSDISQMFDTISYEKGGALIRMMVGFLSQPVFETGLANYIQQHKYGNAASSDLWKAMSDATNNKLDVAKIMDTWTKVAGYPVLMLQEINGGIQIKQQRFFSSKGESDTKWHIYVTYRVPSAPNTTSSVWFADSDASVTVQYNSATDPFIKFDVDENNFYRVNYPPRLWDTLIIALQQHDKILSTTDRAGLLDDAFALAEAGLLPYPTALNLSHFLSTEHTFVVWELASSILLTLGSRLYIAESYGNWQKYMQILLIEPYTQIGWNAANSSALDKQLRRVILNLACQYEVSDCRTYAKSLFAAFITNGIPIDANIRDTVYRVAIADGPSSYFDFLYQRYKNTTNISERDRILTALTYSRYPWQLERLLMDSLNTDIIRSQDTMTVISRVSDNPIGQSLAWDFLRDQWPTLTARYAKNDFSFGNVLTRVTSQFATQREYDEVNTFITTQKDTLGTASNAAPKALATITSNMEWLNKNLQSVADWLKTV